MTLHLGQQEFTGPHAIPDSTVEDLTIQVDPATGTDFTSLVRMNLQSDFTTHGPFASFKGALATLPSNIRHSVTLSHVSGTFTIDGYYFGDWSRFTFSESYSNYLTSRILFTSVDGFVNVAGNVQMTPLTFDDPTGKLTVAADPGYSANAHRGKWLVVTSGPGVGYFAPIRSHSGTEFYLSGDIYLTADSRVDIQEPATTLTFSEATVARTMSGSYISPYPGLAGITGKFEFGKIKITKASGTLGLTFKNTTIGFEGAIFDTLTMEFYHCSIKLRTAIFLGGGTTDKAFGMVESGLFCGNSTEDVAIPTPSMISLNTAWFIYGFTSYGIRCGKGQHPNRLYLYRGSIDSSKVALRATHVTMQLYSKLRSTGNTDYGVLTGFTTSPSDNTCNANFIQYDIEQRVSGGLTGDLGDMSIEDNIVSYDTIESEPDKIIIGVLGTVVQGY